ncbi:MAG: TetR/AcrR family transcriptional regulator [Planctomycetota bacterium]|nr:TetR/AcrR family transcriptional regulator [Planctomycetota bacterium]
MTRPSDTRDRLLSAALDRIWTSSYGSVSVDDICTAAGVKKGSFYHFFPSKEELAVAACEEHWQRDLQPILDRVFHPDRAPLERLEAWCDAIYQEQKARFQASGHVPGCPFASIGSEMGTQNERLRRKVEDLLERGLFQIERTLRDAQKDGSLTVANPAAKARALHALALGLMVHAKVANDPEVLRGLREQVLEALPAPQRV